MKISYDDTAVIHLIKKTIFCVAAAVMALLPHELSAATMRDAFWAQDWKTADAIFSASDATSQDFFPKKLSDMDISLYINALWRRSRYAEAGDLIERFYAEDRKFPDTIKPYADMLLLLSRERTERHDDATTLGSSLWDKAQGSLRYYLAFAMARVERSRGNTESALRWYRSMLGFATDKKMRLRALVPMSELPGMTQDEAALLLIDDPNSKRALAICGAVPKNTNSRVEYALGYRAYTTKKYDVALDRLKAAEADPVYGEAAAYWRGYAAFRLGRYDTAHALWSRIALSNSEYPQRSVARLKTLASKYAKAKVIETLKSVAAKRDDYPDVAADALAAIVDIGGEDDAARARAELFKRFPGSQQAVNVRWTVAWKHWKERRYKQALDEWTEGSKSTSLKREDRARFLYWRARALDRTGKPVAAQEVKRELIESCPSEYYTFLVDKRGGITDTPLPASADIKNELEEWGFATYARLDAAAAAPITRDPETVFRAARLALFEGDFVTGVRTAALMTQEIDPSIAASSKFISYLYPKAFERDVTAASKQTGLPREYIWGIMRQESMYEPNVTSHAGAYGLMQLMPATANAEEKKMKLPKDSYKDPTKNILIGAHHFVGLMAAFKQSPELSLAAYNAGGGRARQWSEGGIRDMAEWVEDIPFRETRGYVKAVMRNAGVYRVLYSDKTDALQK